MRVKSMRVKSMRDIPTIQGLQNRAVPTNRAQAIAEFARLEHEKARLQRELNLWTGNQKKTEERLSHVTERLALLQQVLEQQAADAPAKPGRAAAGGETDGDGDHPRGWKEMSLEY